jgi:hypothetical protein
VQAPAECTTQELRLQGASAEYDAPDTHFRDEWRPALEAARACLARPEHARSCLEVQGQYDERGFDKAVTRALGSERAAQLYRARARGEAVLSELHASGVGSERLRHRPPPTAPTYRGASIMLVADCLPEPAHATPLPAWASSPESVATELKDRGLLPEPPPPSQPPPPPPLPPPPPPSPVWVEAGLGLGVMIGDPDDFVLGGVTAGLGFASTHVYVRGTLGLSLGGLSEQRTAFEYMVAGGYRARPWLDFGLLAGHRIAANALLEPWLSQSWRIGVESSQRVYDGGAWGVWLNEAVSPIGERVDRAVVVDGRVFEVDDRRAYALRFDLSVAVRGHIF